MPGLLVYATGVVVVLSAVAGVAGSANGGDATGATTTTAAATAATKDAAASLQSFFGRGVFHIHHHHHSPETQVAEPDAATPRPAAEAEPPEDEVSALPETDDDAGEADDREAAAEAATAATPAAPARGTSGSSVPSGTWLSGASGRGVADGSLAAWRDTPVTIAGTWADNNEAMTELWQLDPGGEFGSWDQSLDIAIGAIGDGESWQEAATGAYDDRWRESLTGLRDRWEGRSGTLYIRFAHEMNGNWYDWSVDAGDRDAFITAWRKFRALQQEIFPSAQLVFCVNRESVGSGFDWRESFPGSQYVDVMGVDYYNQYPYVADSADWAETVQATDSDGAPKGLQQHLDFARSVGLPLAIPEWSGNADNGDSPAFIEGMHQFFSSNAGGGAGQVIYDVQFNEGKDGGRWLLYGDTQMPKSAAAYRDAF